MIGTAFVHPVARAVSRCLVRGGRHGLAARATVLLCVLAGLLTAQPATTSTAPRFAYVDVVIDPAGKPLAAYQFEFTGGVGCQIVGVEGGEHPAFAAAPYYDPAAMQADRVIAAAYSTAEQLPAGKTRVSRLHLRLSGEPAYQVRLVTAGSTDGKPMKAEIVIREGDVK
jgi:hypothetical protein